MKQTAIAVFIGVLSVVVFFWGNIVTPAVNYTPTVGTNDLTDLHYPYRAFLSQSLKRGEFPLWSAETSSGYPFLASVAGSLYPLTILAAWLPTTTSVTFSIAVSYVLIYCFSFLYLRKIGLSVAGSLFGAVLISFSGFAANEFMHLDILISFYLFLAQLYVLEWLLAPPGSGQKRWMSNEIALVITLGILLGLAILGGHPQITFYSLLFLGPYWLFWWIVKRRASFGKLLSYGAVYGLVGLGIGAGQFLPMLEFTQNSTRSSGLNLAILERYNFPIADLVTFIGPFATFDPSHTMEAFINNGWPKDEQYVYMGLLGLGLALASLPIVRRLGGRAMFFWVAAFMAMLFAFGSQFTTGYILRLPPFSFFRIPFKIIFVVNFSLAVLAALSFERFLNWLMGKGATRYVLWVIIIVATLVSFTDLRYHVKKLYPEVDANSWFSEPEVVAFLRERLRNEERVIDQQYFYASAKIFLDQPELWDDPQIFINLRNLLPNFTNLIYGIPKNVAVANAGGLKLARYNELELETQFKGVVYADMNTPTVTDTFVFLNRLMGVRYFLTTRPIVSTFLTQVRKIPFETGQDPVLVYEFAEPYPRAFLVPRAERAEPAKIRQHLFSGDFDPNLKVYVEEEVLGGTNGAFTANAAFEKYTDQEVVVATQASGDGFLYLSDTYYPGWKASVDGKETNIYLANYAFRAVKVPAGEHRVTFRYEPASFRWGLRITLGTLMVALVAISYLLVRGRSGKK